MVRVAHCGWYLSDSSRYGSRTGTVAAPRMRKTRKARAAPPTPDEGGQVEPGEVRPGLVDARHDHPVQVHAVDQQQPGGHHGQPARVALQVAREEQQEGDGEVGRRPGRCRTRPQGESVRTTYQGISSGMLAIQMSMNWEKAM